MLVFVFQVWKTVLSFGCTVSMVSFDWSLDWMVSCFVVWALGRLIDWLCEPFYWLIDWLIDWFYVSDFFLKACVFLWFQDWDVPSNMRRTGWRMVTISTIFSPRWTLNTEAAAWRLTREIQPPPKKVHNCNRIPLKRSQRAQKEEYSKKIWSPVLYPENFAKPCQKCVEKCRTETFFLLMFLLLQLSQICTRKRLESAVRRWNLQGLWRECSREKKVQKKQCWGEIFLLTSFDLHTTTLGPALSSRIPTTPSLIPSNHTREIYHDTCRKTMKPRKSFKAEKKTHFENGSQWIDWLIDWLMFYIFLVGWLGRFCSGWRKSDGTANISEFGEHSGLFCEKDCSFESSERQWCVHRVYRRFDCCVE